MSQRICPACRHQLDHGWTEGECLCAEIEAAEPVGGRATFQPPIVGITGQLQDLQTGEAAAIAAACPYKRRSLRAAFAAGWRHVPRLADVGPGYEPVFCSSQEQTAFWLGAEARTDHDRVRLLRTHQTNQ